VWVADKSNYPHDHSGSFVSEEQMSSTSIQNQDAGPVRRSRYVHYTVHGSSLTTIAADLGLACYAVKVIGCGRDLVLGPTNQEAFALSLDDTTVTRSLQLDQFSLISGRRICSRSAVPAKKIGKVSKADCSLQKRRCGGNSPRKFGERPTRIRRNGRCT